MEQLICMPPPRAARHVAASAVHLFYFILYTVLGKKMQPLGASTIATWHRAIDE
jgi:hypothetical protein